MAVSEVAFHPPRLRLVTEDWGVDEREDVREALTETLAYLRGQAARLSRSPDGVFYATILRSWTLVLERALRRFR